MKTVNMWDYNPILELPKLIHQSHFSPPLPTQDWHHCDIIASIKKTGTSMAALSRKYGLSSSTLANTLYRKWPRGEKIIAAHLDVPPWVIWPSRYPDNKE